MRADDRTRTYNLLITNQSHYHCATPAYRGLSHRQPSFRFVKPSFRVVRKNRIGGVTYIEYVSGRGSGI